MTAAVHDPDRAPEVFISYAHEDHAIAAQLARRLAAEGLAVWWDDDIRSGHRFDDAIEQAVSRAGCVLVVWSSAAAASDWVRSEAHKGSDRKVLLPVLIENARLPMPLDLIQAIDLVGWRGEPDERVDALVNDVRTLVQSWEARRPTAAVQGRLRDLGFDPGPIDGLEGERTRRAIADLTRVRRGHTQDLLSPDLLAEIDRVADDVADIQRSLDRLGLDPGIPDGVPGPRTMRALRRFLDRNGIDLALHDPRHVVEHSARLATLLRAAVDESCQRHG